MSAIGQSDEMVNGKEIIEADCNSSTDIEQEISHLSRPRNIIIEEPGVSSSIKRPSLQPTDSGMNCVSSPPFSYQTS